MKMDRFREVAASEKERKPAGEESEEPSSELPSTSSGMSTLYVVERDLETKISMLKEKLGFMKRTLDFPALLLTTLEELTEEHLKTFQSHLTSGQLLGFPPIPESQLENSDRQDTVDHMVERYDPEGAVRNTLRILRWMKMDDLAEKLERDHTRAVSTTETKWWSDSSDTGSVKKGEKKHVHLAGSSRALDREAAGSKDTGIRKDKYELVTKPTEKKREALLLATLEELSTDELKIFQQELTPSKQLPPYLTGFPPIPESQLENTDRQDTVDQMVERYGPGGAVRITQRILRSMKREDLAEKFERYHSSGKKRRTSEEPSWPGLVSRGEKIEEDCVPLTDRAPFFIKHKVPDCPCPSHCFRGDQHVHGGTEDRSN